MKKNQWIKIVSLCLLMIAQVFSLTSCAKQGVTSAIRENSQTFFVDITFEGGSGKAHIESPVEVTSVSGEMTAKFVWSSENYDYMIVDQKRYDNENPGGKSTFTIPVKTLDEPLSVIGDTTAMSTPHEIEYLITWNEISSTNSPAEASTEDQSGTDTSDQVGNEELKAQKEKTVSALETSGLSLTDTMKLSYAKGFSIERYGEYSLLTIDNSGVYLIVPQDKDLPQGLPEDVVILQKPLDHTYLVSTSAMDLINACDALDAIKLSGTASKDWYVKEAKAAMESGSILYAGKYRAPDYELLLENGCNLAIENTMIYHEPAVKEKLTQLGIPVLVETSSYEEHPLGRLEWIRLYGVLFDREAEAESYYAGQLADIEPLLQDTEDTGKRVLFFYVTANGLINVRKQGDYITRMIALSGGHYALSNTGESDNALSTMNMQMEDFYEQAHDADIIIYNSTIGGEISSVKELIAKNPLFADFKAVKEDQVYCSRQSLFQQITGMGEFMQDLNALFNGREREYTYLNKLK